MWLLAGENIMGHYDLYGNSYRTALEAMNAEMAQCAAIDAGITEREMERQQTELNVLRSDNYYLGQKVAELEETIKMLEEKLNALST